MRGARRYQSNPAARADAVPGEVYEGSRGVAEASRRPYKRKTPVAPNPPVIGSLRSGGNAQPSRLAARPRAGTNDCKTSSGRSAREPCRRGSRRLHR